VIGESRAVTGNTAPVIGEFRTVTGNTAAVRGKSRAVFRPSKAESAKPVFEWGGTVSEEMIFE